MRFWNVRNLDKTTDVVYNFLFVVLGFFFSSFPSRDSSALLFPSLMTMTNVNANANSDEFKSFYFISYYFLFYLIFFFSVELICLAFCLCPTNLNINCLSLLLSVVQLCNDDGICFSLR